MAAQYGVREIVFGMAHRGRLNVLANVMAKPYRAIFHEFAGGSANPEDVGGSGDVKYHLGTSSDREFDGIKVHMSLVPNPSHLEAVDPVVLGKVARAADRARRSRRRSSVLPVLLHGDAAFAGQGIVGECFGFSGIPGYSTGGCIHFIINNQVGFTTSPQFARSSPYPSDVAKGGPGADPPRQRRRSRGGDLRLQAGDRVSPEVQPRHRHRHVVLSPLRPQRGRRAELHPAADVRRRSASIRRSREVYGARLIEEGVIDRRLGRRRDRATSPTCSKASSRRRKCYLPNKADWFEGALGGPRHARRGRSPRGATSPTGVEREDRSRARRDADHRSRRLADPQDARPHHRRQARDVRERRGLRLGDRRGARLRHAAAAKAIGVRLSGQDTGRGTFSQRHAVWVDQKTGAQIYPADQGRPGRFEVRDSPLSEFGVLGFEYGYSIADPQTLVLWEAQFGDFANGAQMIIDQFIAAGEAKWLRANGLVLLLPHGYEGQGPEHSSARLERFLQLCAEDNMQVAQLHHAGQLFPHPAPADAPRFPQAAGHHDAQVAAAAQAGGVEPRRFHRRQPFQAHPVRSERARRTRTCSGWCCAPARSPTT